MVQLHEKLKTQMAKDTGGRCVSSRHTRATSFPIAPTRSISKHRSLYLLIVSYEIRVFICLSELTKAAQTLCDLDTLLRESSSACVPIAAHTNTGTESDTGTEAGTGTRALTALERYDASLGIDGVALVDARRTQIAAAGAALRDEAERMLWRALEAANGSSSATSVSQTAAPAAVAVAATVTTGAAGERPVAAVQTAAQAAADLGTALQVYCNLGMCISAPTICCVCTV